MGDQSLSGLIANLINRLSDKSLILGIYVGFIVFIRLLHVFKYCDIIFFFFFFLQAVLGRKEGRGPVITSSFWVTQH